MSKFSHFVFNELIKNNSDYFINTYIKKGIEKEENIKFFTETKEIYYILKNDNIYKDSYKKKKI